MRVLRRLTFIRSRGLQAPGAPSAAITYHDFAFSTFLVSSPNVSCLLGLPRLIFLLDLTYRRFVNCYTEGKTDELSYLLFTPNLFYGSTWMAFDILVRWYLLFPSFWISFSFGQYVLGIGGRLNLRHLDEETPFFFVPVLYHAVYQSLLLYSMCRFEINRTLVMNIKRMKHPLQSLS